MDKCAAGLPLACLRDTLIASTRCVQAIGPSVPLPARMSRSQVQLKHNKRKSESIRKLLSRDDLAGGHAADGVSSLSDLLDGRSLGTTEFDVAALREAAYKAAAGGGLRGAAGG